MSKPNPEKKKEIPKFKAYSIVRKNGAYSIVEMEIEGDKVVNVTQSVEDVLPIIMSKVTTKMRPE